VLAKVPGLKGSARRWEESLAAYDRSLAIQPDFERAHVERVLPLIYLNRRSEAMTLARTWAERESTLGYYSRITALIGLALAGDRVTAEKLAEPLLRTSAVSQSRHTPRLHLALGHIEEAFADLARKRLRAYEASDFTHPAYDAVRDDPRFVRQLEELGLLAEYRGAWSHVVPGQKPKARP
jgi:hypothetical protein